MYSLSSDINSRASIELHIAWQVSVFEEAERRPVAPCKWPVVAKILVAAAGSAWPSLLPAAARGLVDVVRPNLSICNDAIGEAGSSESTASPSGCKRSMKRGEM